MPRKRSLKKDESPAWLKSIHQELTNGTTPGEKKTKIGRVGKSSEILAAEAYVVLGIKAEDVERSPKIEHLFKGIGGQAKVFEYLSGSEEPEARKLLDLRKLLNAGQAESVPFEAYCVAATIPVKRMFGIIASEVADQEAKAKQLVFAARHAEVVDATIEAALDVEFGSSDRRMLHQAAGFVPVPKNSITHIHGNQITDNRTQTATVTVLPPVEDTVKRLGDRFNDRILDIKALPAPEVEEEEEEDDDD